MFALSHSSLRSVLVTCTNIRKCSKLPTTWKASHLGHLLILEDGQFRHRIISIDHDLILRVPQVNLVIYQVIQRRKTKIHISYFFPMINVNFRVFYTKVLLWRGKKNQMISSVNKRGNLKTQKTNLPTNFKSTGLGEVTVFQTTKTESARQTIQPTSTYTSQTTTRTDKVKEQHF